MDQIIEQILGYLRGIWRRRWYVVGVAWVVALGGWAWVYTLPDEYRANARVYVDTQSLLGPLLGGMTVQPRIEQRLDVLTRTLLSRPNLEEVARRSDLDLQAGSDRQMEAIISDLERRLRLSGGNRQNLYTISYDHNDPQLARNVVQSLLDIFVESGLGSARGDLSTPQAFIDSQVAQYEERLAELQERITQFKQKHGDLLPGQSGDYYSQLERTRNEYEQARLALNEAQSRLRSYEARLEGTEPTLLEPTPQQGGDGEIQRRISGLQDRLDELRLRYTDQHPDVQATERLIESLEEQQERNTASGSAAGGGSSSGQGGDYVQQLRFALAEAESEVASLRPRVAAYRERYERLQQQVDRIPEIEAEYAKLQDQYKRVKSNYDKLVSTGERAKLSEEVVTNTQSVDFRIVDPPFVPSKPVGPNRVLLSSGVLLFSLAAGMGLAFLLSQLRSTVDTRQTLGRIAARPLLGSISAVPSPHRIRRQRLGLAACGLSAGLLLAAYGGLVAVFLAT